MQDYTTHINKNKTNPESYMNSFRFSSCEFMLRKCPRAYDSTNIEHSILNIYGIYQFYVILLVLFFKYQSFKHFN